MYERTKKILEKLALIFNRNFNAEQLHKMAKEWDEHLHSLSDQQIETAFHLAVLSGASFLPSLPQFVFLAHGFRPAEEAFYELKESKQGEVKNPLIKEASRVMKHAISNKSTEIECFYAFKAAYHFCCAEIVAGRLVEQKK